MDILLMILYCAIVLGFLVVIHEAGHFFAARAFGVRVTEFMIGLPGPHIGFRHKGTLFGLTAVPLGGYARVCGMEPGAEKAHLREVLAYTYECGTLNMEDVAQHLSITNDEAVDALDELVEWGSVVGPLKRDKYNTYRTPVDDRGDFKQGDPRPVDDAQKLYESERKRQYRSLPFWKRCVILLAGPAMNLLFALLVIVIIYSVIGVDIQDPDSGVVQHIVIDPLKSLIAACNYIGMVFVAVVQLFDPQTAADTVSNSTSIVGIAVLSKTAAEQGIESFVMFAAMLSVSLGIMNMLPIPPLDGGRFIVEVFQRIFHKDISYRTLAIISWLGMLLFIGFFLFMLNQDVQRFVLGNW
ncbi:MAG: site-2 protease family protein [Eggerthellaceae bacterium]|jgi:regulator of sigma E protease|nr:site-2 protease family protein [Eggerthellaceae bacterium]MCH4220909.1 site-2 protease family protein [Eggerthellaceae bacterium]